MPVATVHGLISFIHKASMYKLFSSRFLEGPQVTLRTERMAERQGDLGSPCMSSERLSVSSRNSGSPETQESLRGAFQARFRSLEFHGHV